MHLESNEKKGSRNTKLLGNAPRTLLCLLELARRPEAHQGKGTHLKFSSHTREVGDDHEKGPVMVESSIQTGSYTDWLLHRHLAQPWDSVYMEGLKLFPLAGPAAHGKDSYPHWAQTWCIWFDPSPHPRKGSSQLRPACRCTHTPPLPCTSQCVGGVLMVSHLLVVTEDEVQHF